MQHEPLVVTLPRLVGTRQFIEDLVASLPEDCVGSIVTIDASKLVSAAQGSCDELVKQILDIRNTTFLVVNDATPVLERHLKNSARLRGKLGNLAVNLRGK